MQAPSPHSAVADVSKPMEPSLLWGHRLPQASPGHQQHLKRSLRHQAEHRANTGTTPAGDGARGWFILLAFYLLFKECNLHFFLVSTFKDIELMTGSNVNMAKMNAVTSKLWETLMAVWGNFEPETVIYTMSPWCHWISLAQCYIDWTAFSLSLLTVLSQVLC